MTTCQLAALRSCYCPLWVSPTRLAVDHRHETSRLPLAKRIYSAPYGRTHYVVVNVPGVHVRCYHALVAHELLSELETNLMGGVEVQFIIRRERLDDVVVAAPVGFVELLFDGFKLMERRLSDTVNSGDESVGGLLTVGDIVDDAAQTTRDTDEFNACDVFSYTSMNWSKLTNWIRPCRAMTVN